MSKTQERSLISQTARAGGLVIAAAVGLVGPLLLAPPASADPACSPSLTYEVDGTAGTVILFPRATCNEATFTLTIYADAAGESSSIVYSDRPAGTYSGYGVSVPNTGPGAYCATIDIVWSWAYATFTDDIQSRQCITLI
ncbi:hypothetical protein ACIQLJ_16635 [Microbacterium sp. NPDC091313]